MRKIIFSMNTSIDGFIEGPHRELDWSIADAELHDFFSDLLKSGDLLIFGRVTYELMRDYWPTAKSDPNATESERRFADAINPMRKLVFSKTINPTGWNTEVRREFSPEQIKELKSQPGGTILLSGGATMAQAFFQHGLVDEYIAVIHPVAIGAGKALFGGLPDPFRLDYKKSRLFKSGVVALYYRINGKV